MTTDTTSREGHESDLVLTVCRPRRGRSACDTKGEGDPQTSVAGFLFFLGGGGKGVSRTPLGLLIFTLGGSSLCPPHVSQELQSVVANLH